MPPESVQDAMMILLSSKQAYLHIEGKPDRKMAHLIRASVSLGDPGDWEEFSKVQEQLRGLNLFSNA